MLSHRVDRLPGDLLFFPSSTSSCVLSTRGSLLMQQIPSERFRVNVPTLSCGTAKPREVWSCFHGVKTLGRIAVSSSQLGALVKSGVLDSYLPCVEGTLTWSVISEWTGMRNKDEPLI